MRTEGRDDMEIYITGKRQVPWQLWFYCGSGESEHRQL